MKRFKIEIRVKEIEDEIKKDPTVEQIFESGYVKNNKLHRRFVMAQMFRALDLGYTDFYLYQHSYNYTWETILDELKVLSKLQKKDKECFLERVRFFNEEVIIQFLRDYRTVVETHLNSLPRKHCKGVPYVTIDGENIFVADLNKKILNPLMDEIYKIDQTLSDNWCVEDTYTLMNKFYHSKMFKKVQLPYDTPKSKAWFDAFKGSGAYYTLKNLVMYHGCKIFRDDVYGINKTYSGVEAVKLLDDLATDYQGWEMFGLMRKVIADNKFDFHKRMNEIYDN